jgi:signal transduction histidine kinase
VIDEVLAASHGSSPITLSVEVQAEEVAADERLLRHIFINLLSNAVKYSPGGQPVQFTLRCDHGQLLCIVQDHGVGIPEADRAWIFQPFHRGTNTGQFSGTGLGLSIVKRCVELHGGSIRVDSEVGLGTTISVRLEVKPVDSVSSGPKSVLEPSAPIP